MKWNPHLSFDGNCQAAFQFYEQCFGGQILTMLTYGETPMASQAPPEWAGKILHATLTAGTNALMGSDVLPGQYQEPRGFHVLIGIEDPAEASAGRERQSAHVHPKDILGRPFRRPGGSIRCPLGNQLRGDGALNNPAAAPALYHRDR